MINVPPRPIGMVAGSRPDIGVFASQPAMAVGSRPDSGVGASQPAMPACTPRFDGGVGWSQPPCAAGGASQAGTGGFASQTDGSAWSRIVMGPDASMPPIGADSQTDGASCSRKGGFMSGPDEGTVGSQPEVGPDTGTAPSWPEAGGAANRSSAILAA